MTPHDDDNDRWLWLEDVQGAQSLAWVRERNAESRQRLEAWPGFERTRSGIRAVLDAHDRIPAVTRRGAHLYNFWQDAAQPRGLWRRCTLDEYRRPQPAWELLLDLDALGAAEGENWVWGGAQCLGPQYRRALLSLSRGGADAHVVREFDLVDKRFVDDGFTLPEAKSEVAWADLDTVFVGTDFGTGSLTDSGYPRTVRRWRRGTGAAWRRDRRTALAVTGARAHAAPLSTARPARSAPDPQALKHDEHLALAGSQRPGPSSAHAWRHGERRARRELHVAPW